MQQIFGLFKLIPCKIVTVWARCQVKNVLQKCLSSGNQAICLSQENMFTDLPSLPLNTSSALNLVWRTENATMRTTYFDNISKHEMLRSYSQRNLALMSFSKVCSRASVCYSGLWKWILPLAFFYSQSFYQRLHGRKSAAKINECHSIKQFLSTIASRI